MDLTPERCSICAASELHELPEYAALSRVTSDSRTVSPGGRLTVCGRCGAVQKIPDEKWRREIAEIYADFSLDHQSGGEEQLIFDAKGVGLPRSQRIVDFLAARTRAPFKVLDFGCGRGATLKVVAKQWPESALFGAELNDATAADLRAIPGFRKLYTQGVETIDERFDLVLLVHSLAHVVGPVDLLRALGSRLEPEGTLLIQTPDAEKNLYYILVADALTHFSADVLRQAAGRAGLRAVSLTSDIAANELTLLGAPSGEEATPPAIDPQGVRRRVAENIRWLREQAAAALRLSAARGKFGIFGSSLAASWLAGEIGDRFDFFVDEDRRRLGKLHMGRPIIGVDSIPPDAAVFVPLAPNVAEHVMARLRGRGIDCHSG